MAGSQTKLPSCLAILLILLTAPAAAPGASQGARPVTVALSEYQFSPKTLAFRRGVAYRLHIENRGKETHEFTAPGFFKAVGLTNSALLNADKTEIVIQPGEAKDVTFVPKQAGRYPLRCSDHDWAGMIGEIVVK